MNPELLTYPPTFLPFREAPPALPDFRADRGGESVLVRFKANDPRGASRWILQFGEEAQVLEWLVRDPAAQLQRATARYLHSGNSSRDAG